MSFILGQTITLASPITVSIPTFKTSTNDDGIETRVRTDTDTEISKAVITLIYDNGAKYQVQLLGTSIKKNGLTESDFS